MRNKYKTSTLSLVSYILLTSTLLSACFNTEKKLNDTPVKANSPTPPNQSLIKVEHGFVKQGGWEIPALESMLVTRTGSIIQEKMDGNSLEIEYRVHSPNKDVPIIQTLPPVIGDEVTLARINGFTSCSYRGKTYAYSVTAVDVKKDEKSGKYIQDGPGLVYI